MTSEKVSDVAEAIQHLSDEMEADSKAGVAEAVAMLESITTQLASAKAERAAARTRGDRNAAHLFGLEEQKLALAQVQARSLLRERESAALHAEQDPMKHISLLIENEYLLEADAREKFLAQRRGSTLRADLRAAKATVAVLEQRLREMQDGR